MLNASPPGPNDRQWWPSMTRNNLAEHLSWLLTSKLSIPAEGDALPPVSISFTAEPTHAGADIPEHTQEDDGQNTQASAVVGTNAQATAAIEDMARLRTETGSASRSGLVTVGPRMQETPAPRTLQGAVAPPLASNGRVNAVPKPTPFSTGRQAPFSPRQDVEIMDLTESLQHARENIPRIAAGRKRKSSEMAHELPADTPPQLRPAPSPVAMQPPPRGSQQSFTAIDEIFGAPSQPPPPYSTIAPGIGSPRGLQNHNATNRGVAAFGPPESPMMPDSEDDGDDLVDFSRSRSRTPACKKRAIGKQTSMFPERVVESPTKPSALARGNSFTVPQGNMEQALRTTFSPDRRTAEPSKPPQNDAALSDPTQGEAQNEEQALAEQLFGLSESDMQACCQRLDDEYERRLDQLTDCMENDLDIGGLQKLLDIAEERRNAIHVLTSKKKDYSTLADEKEHLRAALKSAIRARSGVENAKAATAACRVQTQALLRECVQHLNLCKDEVVETLRKKKANDEGIKKIAIESTQAPPANTIPKQQCVPSSSRIVQTQMAQRDQPRPFKTEVNHPRRDSPPRIETYFSPRRTKTNTSAKPLHRSPERAGVYHADEENEYGFLNDSDMIEATNQVFSNRMGTPPPPIDPDDFEDEMMLDIDPEELENYGSGHQAAHNAVARPPLQQTSGNGQSLASHKSLKKKKRTPSKNDDANLEHLFRHPWSDHVKEALRDRFRLRGFRENQLQAINGTLAGKDVFVLMPTGGGKSLCYQLPALINSGKTLGVTIVISPLLSLMEDQVQHLRKLRIQAFLINSETPRDSRDAVMEAMDEENVGQYIQLLYVTPEMLAKSQKMINAFERLYRRQRLARLVIDEAHCVSQWGHDFRPDYKLIGDVRKRFPTVPVMALTATATENVKMDTVHNLGITGCEIFTSSFNRPNLYYEVRPKPKGKEDVRHIAELIKENYHRKSGIIYCLSRKNCETMAASLLKDHKIKAHHYHAGLESEDKKKIQKDWQAGVHHVIVATIAFGMGIDKPDVRFVIHHTIPKSLEGYYQETGRAGRDQLESGCYLFYGYQDVSKLRRMIDDGDGDWEQKERQHQMLRRMAQYCDNKSDCRRVQVLRYFNEDFDAEDCDGKCDNCCSGSNFQSVDFTEYAQQAVSLVGRLAPQKTTLLHCMDVFRGAATKKITESRLNELDEYGAGKDLDRGDVERLFYHLLTERAIIEENVVNKSGFANQYAVLGKHCGDFRNGKRKLHMQMRSTPKPKAKVPAKKRAKRDPFEEQSKNWKKTAGSRAPAEMPMSTNISSPIQAATGRRQPNQRVAGRMHDNGYQRDNFVVSDPEDNDYADSDEDSFDDGFAPVRVDDRPQRSERMRGPSRPITADDMLNDLDDVARDAIEQFVQEGKELARKLVVDKGLRMVPFSDTMLRHMAIMRTTTPNEMLNIPEVNPENVSLWGKRFCRLVQGFIERYDEMIQPAGRPDPNARNVIDLVSDEEEEESDDEYGDFPFGDEGEASGYFQPPVAPSADVASFNARVYQMEADHAYNGPEPARQRKGAKVGKKRNFKATGSYAAPRRKGISGSRFAGYAHKEPSTAGVGKRRAAGKRKSSEGGRAGGTSRGGSGAGRSMTNNTAGNRSVVAMMPT